MNIMDTMVILSVVIFATVHCIEKESSILTINLTSFNFLTLRQNQFSPVVREDRIKFVLYTRKYPNGFRLIRNNNKNLCNSNFNSSYQTKVIIHGYVNNYISAAIQLPKNAYLFDGNFNVITVDWSEYSFPYFLAANSARTIGHLTGLMVSYLSNKGGLKLSDLHFIGHSLGAHVAGYAVEKIGAKPARITGLDPAAPLFSENPPNDRLGAEDAYFVDVIHTSVRVLGIAQNIGHADFYPAGGKHQPRCSSDIVEEVIGSCDHGQSYIYFSESILKKNQFPAVKCRSLSDALERKCKGRKITLMGDSSIDSSLDEAEKQILNTRLTEIIRLDNREQVLRRLITNGSEEDNKINKFGVLFEGSLRDYYEGLLEDYFEEKTQLILL